MTETLGLYTLNETPIALQGIKASVKIHELLSEVALSQTYKNTELSNIEAVYTFALPPNAVLLSIGMNINGRQLSGDVTPRAQAEATYEDAITDGDSAMLLNRHDDGLYTVNVGNLNPGDEATIDLGYAELLEWQGDQIRFVLPTVIGERYGDVEHSSLRPHEEPVTNGLIEHLFTLEATLSGNIAQTQITCPSHAMTSQHHDSSVKLSFASGRAFLDRDFVLDMRRSVFMSSHPTLITCKDPYDQGSFVQLASFQPVITDSEPCASIDLKIVVDCSGSMSGDSMTQARDALHSIMEQLTPNDTFSIVRFGSTTESFSRKMLVASAKNIAKAHTFVEATTATLGGTEMEAALSTAYSLKTLKDTRANVLLITDGLIWHGESIISKAQNSDHRLFTVGVGSAVSAVLMQDLADTTQGACELVTPNEKMAERIIRHFQRIRCPAVSAQFNWGDGNENGDQSPSRVRRTFPVDTLHVFQRRASHATEQLLIQYTDDENLECTQIISPAPLPEYLSPSVIARLAANARLNEVDDQQEATDLAVRYQLMTQYTALAIVDVREEKIKDLPELRTVPQMHSAGWGGRDSALYSLNLPSSVRASGPESCYLDIPAFLRREPSADIVNPSTPEAPLNLTPFEFAKAVCAQLAHQNDLDLWTISTMEAIGLDQSIVSWLKGLAINSNLENTIVTCFLYELMSTLKAGVFERQIARVITKAHKQLGTKAYNPTDIQQRVNLITDRHWQ